MFASASATKVSVYINRDTSSPKGFLYLEILRLLQDRGIDGATVFAAHAGFGRSRRLHSSDANDVAGEHLPMVLTFIDEPAKVNAVLPDLLALVTDGLVEAHPTEILKHVSKPEKVLS